MGVRSDSAPLSHSNSTPQLHTTTTTTPQLHTTVYNHNNRMPEVDKQLTDAQTGEECEVKPGGLKFNVILEEAKTADVPEMRSPPTPSPSAEDIELKLKAAEERRKSLEACALEKWAEKEKRAAEVRAKKATNKDGEQTEEDAN